MKKIKILAAVLFAAMMLLSFEGVQAQNNKNNVAEITFSVPSIDCDHWQQKVQNNGFQSREQAASVQAAIERQGQDLQELQARLGSELAAEPEKSLQRSLHS